MTGRPVQRGSSANTGAEDRGRERQDFLGATELYQAVLAEVGAEQWALPARGELSVLEVAAQGSRSLTTTRDFVAAGADRVDLRDSVNYFVRDRPLDSDTIGGIRRRGQEALERFQQNEPVDLVARLVREALAAVDGAADDALVGSQFGGIRLLDYLPTRTLEMVACSLEVAAAIDSPTTPGIDLLASVADLLSQVALAGGRGTRLVRTIWAQVQLA